jgi:hypothetical protein
MHHKSQFFNQWPLFFKFCWVILGEDYENEHEKVDKMLFHRFFVDLKKTKIAHFVI